MGPVLLLPELAVAAGTNILSSCRQGSTGGQLCQLWQCAGWGTIILQSSSGCSRNAVLSTSCMATARGQEGHAAVYARICSCTPHSPRLASGCSMLRLSASTCSEALLLRLEAPRLVSGRACSAFALAPFLARLLLAVRRGRFCRCSWRLSLIRSWKLPCWLPAPALLLAAWPAWPCCSAARAAASKVTPEATEMAWGRGLSPEAHSAA